MSGLGPSWTNPHQIDAAQGSKLCGTHTCGTCRKQDTTKATGAAILTCNVLYATIHNTYDAFVCCTTRCKMNEYMDASGHHDTHTNRRDTGKAWCREAAQPKATTPITIKHESRVFHS